MADHLAHGKTDARLSPPIAPPGAVRLHGRPVIGAWLVAVVLLAGVVAVVLWMGELERFVELARRADPAWLLAAVGLQALTYTAVGWVWWMGLSRSGSRQALAGLMRLAIIKLFADQAIPSSGLSGTLVVTRALAAQGVAWPVALGAMLYGAVTRYAAYLVAVLVAIGFLWLLRDAKPVFVGFAVLASCVAVVVPVSLLLAKRWVSHPRVLRIARWLDAEDALRSLVDAPTDLLRRPILVLAGVAAQVGVFLLDSLTLLVAFRALGQHVGLPVTFSALVMATVAVTLGPIPISVGTFEAACVAVLVSLDVPTEEALAATLVLRGFTFWLPMVPGSFMLRRELTRNSIPNRAPVTPATRE